MVLVLELRSLPRTVAPVMVSLVKAVRNPTRAGDIIPPISSSEFLKTRDDTTIRNIISQGQPDIGMSPFGDANGGPLNDDQLDALVEYIRSWEANPPVQGPPQFRRQHHLRLPK